MIELAGMVIVMLVGLAVWIRLGHMPADKNKKNPEVRVWKTSAVHGFQRIRSTPAKNKKNPASVKRYPAWYDGTGREEED